ncbi:MAG TPA: hypothetical protein VMM83_07095 [Longimicrobiales bacterium]|nr:hypothetical protein [Longimicrobiales bacterium]
MKRISTKTAAEAVLRELPSVMGAYVAEDMEGQPREIHLLVRPGPEPGSLARDIRNLLEERLGIPIDQRVISIAQLARTDEEFTTAVEPAPPQPPPARSQRGAGGRPVFAGLESTVSGGHVQVTVRLEWRGEVAEGTAEAADTQPGRARAAATATLKSAITAPWSGGLNFELDFASLVQALDGEYVLVSVLGMSPMLGRRPLPLVGAQPIDGDVESAAALATLKAVNRVLSLALDDD